MYTLRHLFKLHALTTRFLVAGLFVALVLAPTGRFVLAEEATDTSTPATTETTDTTPPADTTTTTEESAAAPAADEAPAQALAATSTDGTGGASSDTGGTVITNDANASTTVDNVLNLSEVNADQPNTEMNSSTFTASSTNAGTLESTATSTATTGENAVIGGEGANLIVTGNAISTANVINEVNTNIFNSDGLIIFLNDLFGDGVDLGSYDLTYFFAGGAGASPTVSASGEAQCTLLTCLNSSSLNVWNTNDATVTNSVIVRSATGENMASSTGDASIDTGDAYAAANVVNLVNTNIINSSYLLVAYNNFGDLESNVTLPSADFFSDLFETGAASTSMNASTYEVSAVNDVNLTGTTTATAVTGENVASSTLASVDPASTSTPEATGAGVITTGDAYASSHTYNQANTNNVGGTSVFMLFRVSGDWSGSIKGLPAGLTPSIMRDGNDTLIQFISDNGTTTPTAAKLLEEYNSSHFSAISTSSADIENNIDVSADTGSNIALTQNGTSTIATGDAYASANVVNLVNTNIVGQNWIFGVFNIFGDFNGDIVFGGSPILAVGAAPSAAEVAPGSDVTYTFSVTNSGSSDASDVVVNASFDNTLLTFAPVDGVEMTATPTGASWRVGKVRKGQTRSFTVTAHVGTNFPAGQRANVPFTAAAVNDNIASPSTSETVSAPIVVSSPQISSSNSGGGSSGGSSGNSASKSTNTSSADRAENPKLSVDKTASLATSTSGVDYKVIVYNEKGAGPLFSSTLTDTLYDPAGAVVYKRAWSLGTVAPGDEIKLTYTVSFATTSSAGTYTNVATVEGKRNYATGSGAKSITPVEARASVQYGAGRVLGVATSTIAMPPVATSTAPCMPLLSQNMRPGRNNNAISVMTLQSFLNTQVSANLPLTGYFGPLTTQAVKQFQTKYAAEILTPVGLSMPSGLVYPMTLRKINSLACGGAPLAQPLIIPPAPSTQPASAVSAAPKPAPKPKAAAPAAAKKAPAPAPEPAPAPQEEPAAPAPAPEKQSSGFFGWIKGLF